MQDHLQSQLYQQQQYAGFQQQHTKPQQNQRQNNPHLQNKQEMPASQQLNGSDDSIDDFEDTDECVISKNQQENTHNIPQSSQHVATQPHQQQQQQHERVNTQFSGANDASGGVGTYSQGGNINQQQFSSQQHNNIPRSSAQLKSHQTLQQATDQSISPKYATQNQYNSNAMSGFGSMINQGFNSKSTAKLNIQSSVLIPSSAHKQPGDYDGQFDPEQYSQTFLQNTNNNSNNNNNQQSIPNQHQMQTQQYLTQQQQQQKQQQQQQYSSNQQQSSSTQPRSGMITSKSHKNFHSVVGTHSYNQLTNNHSNNTQSHNRNANNHLLSGSVNPNSQQQLQYLTQGTNQQYDTLSNGNQKNKDPEQDKDFNRAYLKLVKKMYQESGQNLLITQEEVEKIAYQQQCITLQDFNQRNQQCIENKQHKTKLLQEMKQQQEMQECTFKPQTYSQKQKRNFDQFLKDQAQFAEQKNKKNRDRMEQNMSQQQRELKMQPQVNKKSVKIVEQKKKQIHEDINDMQLQDKPIEDKPVYERLHRIHHEKMQRQVQKAIEHTNHLTGKSNNNNTSKSVGSRNLKKNKSEANFTSTRDRELQSGKTVDEMLYEDAKRRWEKQEIKKKNLEKLKDEQIQSTKPPTGNNNTKFAAQKFEKEYYFLVHHIMMDSNGQDTQDDQNQDFNLREYDNKKINYVKLGQLMTELGYIPTNIAPDSVERELLFDLWTMLQGEENSGIQIINIKKILLAIQGICIDQVERNLSQINSMDFRNHASAKTDSNQHDNNRISQLLQNNFDDNGILRINQQETNKLFVKFKALYVNRIQFLGQFKRVKQVENACTFKPQISQTSEQLAMQRRMRILGETRQTEGNGEQQENNNENQNNANTTQDPTKVDIVSLLLHPINTDKQWQQNAKHMLDQKELEECTFKPRILNYQGDSTRSRILTNQNSDKCLELYNKAKPLREKRDKTRNDYEFEKAQEQCTFQPNIQESQKGLDQMYMSQQQQMYGDSQFLGSDGGLNQTTTQNIKGYQLMMARMQKGREDREKVKQMTSRGIPGTVTDESQMKPLYIEGNTNYKGTFSTFSHHPDFNIHVAQQLNANNSSQMTATMNNNNSRSRLQSSKSNESLHSLTNVTSQQSKRQSQNQYSKIANNNSNNNNHNQLRQSQNHEKENIYYQNPLSNSMQGSIFGQDKSMKYQDNNNNRANSALSQQQQQQNRYQNQRISDLSYENDKNTVLSGGNATVSNSNNGSSNYNNNAGATGLTTGNGYLNLPSDTDPDHSIASKATTIKQPLLYVDVNLGPGKSERIVVYEGDTAEGLADKFAMSHGLDLNMRGKLTQLLDSQIAGLLEKIEEEQNSIHSDNI